MQPASSARASTISAGPTVPVPGLPHSSPSPPPALCVALAAGTLWACSGRSPSDPGSSAASGTLIEKPGGGFFLADGHSGGGATRLHLLEMGSGRLVDVYDVDAQGETNPTPVL